MAKHEALKASGVDTPEPDPVAERAAKFALEVTEPHPKRKNKMFTRLLWSAVAFLVVAGTFGAVIGTINTFELNRQQNIVQQEQKCQTELLDTFTKEQKARANISADDRQAALILAKENIAAKTQKQREAAYAKYQTQLRINDANRAKYPVPTFDNTACKVTRDEAKRLGLVPGGSSSSTPTSIPTSLPSSTGATSNYNGSAANSAPSSANNGDSNGGSNGGQGKAPKPRTSTKIVTRQPQQPATSSSSTRNRLVPLPSCTISVLGLNVC